MSRADRVDFIEESNRIEGIHRVTDYEIDAHERLWALDELTVGGVEAFVCEVAAARPLRDRPGMNVRVGSHLPPPGGPGIPARLASLLDQINHDRLTPFDAHVEYETLHPFMDGNGRSGRAVWAWQMLRSGGDPFGLGFLHRWYYASLGSRRPLALDEQAIERAARALVKRHGYEWDPLLAYEPETCDEFCADVRAVIAALRNDDEQEER